MTQAQAVSILHERLPMRAGFTVFSINSVHGDTSGGVRTEPDRFVERNDWIVEIYDGNVYRSKPVPILNDAVAEALAQFESASAKPPKAGAQSSAGEFRKINEAG